MEKYSGYSVEQFASDPDFISWVKTPDSLSRRFWREFLIDDPHMKCITSQAKAIILSLEFNDKLTGSEKEAIWDHIQTAIVHETSS